MSFSLVVNCKRMQKLFVFLLSVLLRRPLDIHRRLADYQIDHLNIQRRLDILSRESIPKYVLIMKRMLLLNLAGKLPGTGRFVTTCTRRVLVELDDLDDQTQRAKYDTRLTYKKRRLTIQKYANQGSIVGMMEKLCIEQDTLAAEAAREIEQLVASRLTCNIKAFYNLDGSCAFNAAITCLIHSPMLTSIVAESEDNRVAEELVALSTCNEKVVHAVALRKLLTPGLEYIPTAPLGGGIAYMYIKDIVSRLPVLERVSKAKVVIGRQATDACIHQLVAMKDSTLKDLFDLNDYRFETLPDMLFIRIFKSPRGLTSFQEYMIGCPLTSFKITSTRGETKTYNLRATVEHQPGHSWAHVKVDDKWYKVDNGVSFEITNPVTSRSNFLVYEV